MAGRRPDGPVLMTWADSQSPARLAGVAFCGRESRARAVGRRQDRRRRPDGPSAHSGVRWVVADDAIVLGVLELVSVQNFTSLPARTTELQLAQISEMDQTSRSMRLLDLENFQHRGRERLIAPSDGRSVAICAARESRPASKCASRRDLSGHTGRAQLAPRGCRRERENRRFLGTRLPGR